jgi:hypothetical protein
MIKSCVATDRHAVHRPVDIMAKLESFCHLHNRIDTSEDDTMRKLMGKETVESPITGILPVRILPILHPSKWTAGMPSNIMESPIRDSAVPALVVVEEVDDVCRGFIQDSINLGKKGLDFLTVYIQDEQCSGTPRTIDVPNFAYTANGTYVSKHSPRNHHGRQSLHMLGWIAFIGLGDTFTRLQNDVHNRISAAVKLSGLRVTFHVPDGDEDMYMSIGYTELAKCMNEDAHRIFGQELKLDNGDLSANEEYIIIPMGIANWTHVSRMHSRLRTGIRTIILVATAMSIAVTQSLEVIDQTTFVCIVQLNHGKCTSLRQATYSSLISAADSDKQSDAMEALCFAFTSILSILYTSVLGPYTKGVRTPEIRVLQTSASPALACLHLYPAEAGIRKTWNLNNKKHHSRPHNGLIPTLDRLRLRHNYGPTVVPARCLPSAKVRHAMALGKSIEGLDRMASDHLPWAPTTLNGVCATLVSRASLRIGGGSVSDIDRSVVELVASFDYAEKMIAKEVAHAIRNHASEQYKQGIKRPPSVFVNALLPSATNVPVSFVLRHRLLQTLRPVPVF